MSDENNVFMGIEENFISFGKWLLIATFVGAIVGLIGTAFHFCIDYATELRLEYTYLIFLLPLGGALIAYLYKTFGLDKEKGTNAVLQAVRSSEVLSGKTAPLIFISTVITHLFGGSSGREGAALQLGGSLASIIGRHIKLSEEDMRIITSCGMSAGFSALFGTPITSVVFAMEVSQVGVMNYYALVPALISSITGFLISQSFGVAATRLHIMGIPELTPFALIQVIILTILCAFVSILFCLCMRESSRFYKLHISNKMLRAFVGGVIVIVLTFIVGNFDYNGGGMDIVEKALSGTARPEAFILKIIFTAVTLSAGFKGGEIVPSFFVGATFGNVASSMLGINPSFGAGIGLIAVFCGVTNCPLTSLILSIELFGMEGLIFFAAACAISYMLSGYSGLYSAQKIVYSKAKCEKINRNTIH